jgi:hypothetical protein
MNLGLALPGMLTLRACQCQDLQLWADLSDVSLQHICTKSRELKSLTHGGDVLALTCNNSGRRRRQNGPKPGSIELVISPESLLFPSSPASPQALELCSLPQNKPQLDRVKAGCGPRRTSRSNPCRWVTSVSAVPAGGLRQATPSFVLVRSNLARLRHSGGRCAFSINDYLHESRVTEFHIERNRTRGRTHLPLANLESQSDLPCPWHS